MKRFISQLVVIASVIFIAASCQQAPFITMTGPRSFTFTRDGGTQSFSFACNREWSVSSTESWVKISPSSGSAADGETKVTITCSPNTTYDARSATITVKVAELSETISISQDTGLGLIVSPKSFDLTNAAQTIEIEVQKNVQYSITIDDAGKSWITHAGTKGLSSEKASFSIAANDTYDNREAKITFKQTDGDLFETVVVKQSQTDGLFITTPEYNLSNVTHTLSVDVNANVEYEVTSQAEWIKYVETKALQPSTITLSVAANDIYDTRTGKVIVKQTNGNLVGEIIVNQAEKYGLFVSPEEVNISKDAQTVEVEVKYNVDYDIIIPEAAKDWISIQAEPNTKSLKNETVSFAIAKNAKYYGRETAIAFKQKDGDLTGTVKIVQAQTDYLEVSPLKDSISYESGSIDVKVKTNLVFSLVKDDSIEWITFGDRVEKEKSEGLTTYVCPINAVENEITKARYATVSLSTPYEELSASFILAQGPQPYIEFADKDIKAALIAKFDGNKDGELSYKEAASVKSIEGVFELKSYHSFEEFAYFTGVETVPSQMFDSWEELTSIKLPKSIKEIGGNAFNNCYKLQQLEFPEGLTVIPAGVCKSCKNLAIITIPSTVKTIESSAFWECFKLNNVILPDNLDTIGILAFATCTSLEYIRIPDGVTIIPEGLFSGSSRLKEVILPSNLKRINKNAFHSCSSLKEIIIPNTVDTIDEFAFAYCHGLEKIILPESLNSVNYYSFAGCSSLQEVKIPESVTEISQGAFAQCFRLQSIVIPKNVTNIAFESFAYCSGLKSITVLPITPPSCIGRTLDGDMFMGTNCPIFVLEESLESYKTALYWCDYANRIQAIPWVDLGLSVKWAKCNIGAIKPEDYGDYYAWGEREPYYKPGHSQDSPCSSWQDGKNAGYDWPSYKWCDGSYNIVTKYNTKSDYGTIDNKSILETGPNGDDIASIKLGGNWRMPTDEEWTELRNNCTWTKITQDGKVMGRLVTSNINGNSIFLPNAGCRSDLKLFDPEYTGYYWSSSLDTEKPTSAWSVFLGFNDDVHRLSNGRWGGYSIRPVIEL